MERLGRRTGPLQLEMAGSEVRDVKVVVARGGRGRRIRWRSCIESETAGTLSYVSTTDSSVDQQHRTTFCELKHARSRYEPAIFMGSGFFVDASSGVHGKEGRALAVGGGRVRGTRSSNSGSGSMWGEGLEKVEELQREQEGMDSYLGTADSSVDQQHRATFYALKYARSNYIPTFSMGSGFLVDASQGVPNPFRAAVPFWGQTT